MQLDNHRPGDAPTFAPALRPLVPGIHAALIMDGNGRWATARGLPRVAGHRAGAETLHLRVAIDYSARDLVLRAAAALARTAPQSATSREAFAAALAAEYSSGAVAPDVDLLIRTGGEKRLSDFMLWEAAYAELYF